MLLDFLSQIFDLVQYLMYLSGVESRCHVKTIQFDRDMSRKRYSAVAR